MLGRFRLILAVVLLWGVGALVTRAQDAPAQDLINAILRYMRGQLGRPISAFDTYTYQAATFADSSLDCPVKGKTYQPGPFSGYKFLLTSEGIVYDVRSTVDGAEIVLCANEQLRQNVALATYRSPQYSIPYPAPWNAIDRGTDVYFGLAARPLCAQPGMIVAPLAAANGKTPDALIDEFVRTQRRVEIENVRIAIGKTGSSAVFVAPCTDGSPRKHRVTVFVAYGQAYRVLQFTPLTAFSQWDDIFRKILDEFAPAAGGAPEGGQPILPPAVSPLAAIAHIFGGNVYVGTLVDLPGLPVTSGARPDRAFTAVTISPKGDLVAYIDPYRAILYVAPLSASEPPRAIAANISPIYPPAWNPAGDEIAYLAPQSAEAKTLTAYAIRPDGQNPREIGATQAFSGPCQGAPPADPAERLYSAEVGAPGFPKNALYWTKTGRLYFTLVCGSGIGVIPASGGTGEAIRLDLYGPRLSPDESAFVGMLAEGGEIKQPLTLLHIKLTDNAATALPISTGAAVPESLAWSADGRALYYGVSTLKQRIRLDDAADAERGTKAFGSWPVESAVYEVVLHRIDLASGVDAELYKASGRGIGRIAPAPDGSGVLFTFIQDSSTVFEAFNNNASPGELLRLMPQSRLYWLPLDGDAQLVAISVEPVWGPPGSALAPTPTGGVGTYAPGKIPSATPTPRPTRTPSQTPTPQAPAPGAPLPTNTPRATPTANTVG